MNILIKGLNWDPKVINFMYTKQAKFKKEKGKVVSLEKTLERLLKDAYGEEIKNEPA